jgi:uncharacterized repeat protein (TIGR01451 family)
MGSSLAKSVRLALVAGFALPLAFSASCTVRDGAAPPGPKTQPVAARPRPRAARLTNVNGTPIALTAQRATTPLRDGTAAPMWGYCPTGSCASQWTTGPTIVANAGETLQITLTNGLPVPTSLVVLGLVGGGLGSPVMMDSPVHAGQNNTTFPGNGAAPAPFIPPAQAQRVRSFGTEVAAGASATLTWTNLKPGTYLYETGTLPSLQAPMGLYGALVVNASPGVAYPGVPFDDDAALLFSEMDPVQNAAVDAAALAGTDVNLRFNDPLCAATATTPSTCYPAAVNYTPTCFFINGRPFDVLDPQGSAVQLADTASYSSGNLLVRLLNAGSRTHTPSIVGLQMSLVAEDGNPAPGNPKLQGEVLLTAGKTHDALVRPAGAAPSYAPATYPLFDRSLALTSAGHTEGGMQAFLLVNHAGAVAAAGGVSVPGTPGNLPAAVVPAVKDDTFNVPYGGSVSGDVTANDFAVAGVTLGAGVANGTLDLHPDGTFTYVANAAFSGTDTFTYVGNGGAGTATVSLVVAAKLGGAANMPVAKDDSYLSPFANTFSVARPGVLANDSDPNRFPLFAGSATPAASGGCATVDLKPDGSFSVTGSGASCRFTYLAMNSQGNASAPATVTVRFGPPGGVGLSVAVVDGSGAGPIGDYRWTLQEDLTFKHDVSSTPPPGTRTVGTSFHRSHMPVVATGCVGPVSCGDGQTVRGAPQAAKPDTPPSSLRLDPARNYYLSILPGDGSPPGHAMGGAEIKANHVGDPVTIKLQATPLVPAQLSIYIYEDNNPTNGMNDTGESGLGGFNVVLFDPAGRTGDPAGQQSYDAFNMPLSNYLLGRPGCPDELNAATNGTGATGGNLVGAIYTCPNAPPGYTGDPARYALAGHALIKNITPARYDVVAHPGAAREGAGEVWWQTETLEGTAAQDAFTGVNEPVYFQEFGPPGPHTTIGFVNPNHLASNLLAASGGATITGKVTSQHMSRPSDVTLWDASTYDLLSSTTCRVTLNSQGGDGPAVAAAECAPDGTFTLSGIAPGEYDLAVFDEWLDQIIQNQAVSVPVGATAVALGNVQVLSWFTQYDQNIFQDLNGNGVYDDGEPGISNVPLTVRFRNGAPSNSTLSDSNGNGILVELFPLFNWYVAEADTTRFKQTGVHIVVDGGGKPDSSGAGANLWSSKYATGEPSVRTELPGALTYGLQGFISQRNRVDWGRTPYVKGENGGIAGTVVYSSTRPFDDMRFNVQTIWEPLVPRVTVNLYKEETLPDGTHALTLVDTTLTSSFDDFVNLVRGSDGVSYLLGSDGTLRDPATGAPAPAGVTAGVQVNLQCPGQLASDPFVNFTLGAADRQRCYDGWHNWNQIQAAPYDGRYQFPSPAYVAGHPLTAAQTSAGQTLVSLPPGNYVVEAVTPPGYEVVKEEDKNILIGDVFDGPASPQFGPLASIFILPDQATLGNANPDNPSTGDPGYQSDPTSNLGVYGLSNATTFPECVGALHRVPDFLSLYPQAAQVAPFAGMDRPLCDRKRVALNDQMQSSATFFIFTEVPVAANNTGIILDDATSEFNALAPDFGEKASVPDVPVSIKDFTGNEIGRTYSDQWGAYNMMVPSSWLVNPPTPSGYGPNMLITCMNDPGPIPDPVTGKLVTDPHYNPAYSNFCYTNPFMPGQTTYLDTPVLPVAAFASGYNPPDCALPASAPAILRVDSSAGLGPWLPSASGRLTILAQGDVQVPNPAYAGPFATSGIASQQSIPRHYGFGATAGRVTVNGVRLGIVSWSDQSITASVPAGTTTGELVVTTSGGVSSVDAVTVTIEPTAPKVVSPSTGGTIQGAIDVAAPGDLILLDAGTYNELVVMWKPVRLQGVGAASVIINAAKFPTSKLDQWRQRINQLFNVDLVTGNVNGPSQVDPLPTQEITGGVVLLEPSVLGSEEGAGITVLAKNLGATDCDPGRTFGADSNFLCWRSRIDGVSVTGGDAGGGIYVNGWAHGLEISNNRVYGNAGAYNGGVRVGVPYLEEEALPVNPNGTVGTFGYDVGVNIHHNQISKNGTVEAPAGSGGAGGGVSICSGSDGYRLDHNWICGNYSSSDGGGIGHLGYSQGGAITNNTVLFNQSFQQTNTTHGGGIVISGEPPIAGALSLGTGNVTIDANLIRGNFAESGSGGGIRLQQVNGADVALNPGNSSRWFRVTITNNIIDDNIAGYGGGGLSLADTVVSAVVNNTIASNDSVGIAGVVLTSPSGDATQSGTGIPSPAGLASELNSAGLVAAIPANQLTATQRRISSPTIANDVIWRNRSFLFKTVAGAASLCSSNNAADAAGTGCNRLADQTSSGQCTALAGGGAPAYWEIGVLGDRTPVPTATPAPPVAIAAAAQYSLLGVRYVVVTTASRHGFVSGETVTIAGFSGTGAALYNGAHPVLDIPAILQPLLPNLDLTTMFVYLPTSNGVAALPALTNGTATPPSTILALSPTFTVMSSTAGYSGAGLSSADPRLADPYCNGARVTPEYGGVLNPPSVLNLAVAATADEGNNYVNLRYGPLYLAKPVSAGATATARFGDYHLAATATPANSSTVNHGTNAGAPSHDFDGDPRPLTVLNPADIGADEVPAPAPQADLAVTITDNTTTVSRATNPLVTYVINVTNLGPAAVTGAQLLDVLPGGTRYTVQSWSCSASGGSCTVGGSGNTSRSGTVSLQSGGTAVFTMTGRVPVTAPLGSSTDTVTITPPAGTVDPVTANNTATDVDTIQ